jgi:hypothetical protein
MLKDINQAELDTIQQTINESSQQQGFQFGIIVELRIPKRDPRALDLIEQTLARGYRRGGLLLDFNHNVQNDDQYEDSGSYVVRITMFTGTHNSGSTGVALVRSALENIQDQIADMSIITVERAGFRWQRTR